MHENLQSFTNEFAPSRLKAQRDLWSRTHATAYGYWLEITHQVWRCATYLKYQTSLVARVRDLSFRFDVLDWCGNHDAPAVTIEHTRKELERPGESQPNLPMREQAMSYWKLSGCVYIGR
jgi:hypothetical protein